MRRCADRQDRNPRKRSLLGTPNFISDANISVEEYCCRAKLNANAGRREINQGLAGECAQRQ
jgi:hypothetical protein